jgi:predicted secreted protein
MISGYISYQQISLSITRSSNMGSFAHGTTVTIGGTTIAGVTSVTPFDESRDSLEVTSHSSGKVRRYVPGLQDGGDITIEGRLITADAGQIALKTNLDSGGPVALVVTYPGTTSNRFTVNAFVTAYSASAPFDEVGTFTATLKADGKVVVSSATL